MKLGIIYFRSSLARRVVLLFISCAMFPVLSLAIISFSRVTEQLLKQSQKRRQQTSKAVGMEIVERLSILAVETENYTHQLRSTSPASRLETSLKLSEGSELRFRSLSLIARDGRTVPLLRNLDTPPGISATEERDLRLGKVLVTTQYRSDSTPGLFLLRAVDPDYEDRGILVVELDPHYVWGVDEQDRLSPTMELCVLESSAGIAYSSLPLDSPSHREIASKAEGAIAGQFEWSQGDREYLASYWSVRLLFDTITPNWKVVVFESRDEILAPIADFKRSFIHVLLITLLVVALLSAVQIRRSLIPLKRLKEGTRRIAARDFRSRVQVTSRDEFEELATSFNSMADQLGRQFGTLGAIGDIVKIVLSALDEKEIAATVLRRLPVLLPSRPINLMILDSEDENSGHVYTRDDDQARDCLSRRKCLTPEDVDRFHENPEKLEVRSQSQPPEFLRDLQTTETTGFLLLPLFIKEGLAGSIIIGVEDSDPPAAEDINHVRQVADQVAVALTNARLLEELDRLNWGTLTALARAVDAKSPWTAGHSERNSIVAVKIGQALGLGTKELDNIHRGALLHDIGKIGIPSTIIDKPGTLTPEEMAIIRRHLVIGARILEPIAAYTEVIPMVLYHHERFDGTGYPDGLAGEDIPLAVRILSVADCFDAITSDRPYRPGLGLPEAIRVLEEEAGRQLDPVVVEAFLRILEKEGLDVARQPASTEEDTMECGHQVHLAF